MFRGIYLFSFLHLYRTKDFFISDAVLDFRLPWFYMTDEVVEAATLCLVAQAEEIESSGRSTQVEIEKAILKEFGRCLGQVIESALKNSKKTMGS